ncbi:diacylglycerol/lipid kinase family protein [Arcanobacterium ihumii]|uniref:diacylglycerol/lipid kinase family protein n=1 Tax=Arcanobacterium ihumii TaxID=2138162 RepID=UPI000F53F504|nr:diacylglycerol kinase family protein [Arcanobacterium ihumii]
MLQSRTVVTMNAALTVSIVALVLAFIAVCLGCVLLFIQVKQRKFVYSSNSHAVLSYEDDDIPVLDGPPCVIYNPSKTADWKLIRKELMKAAQAARLPEPVWIKTTEDDPGEGQAKRALEMRACVVIAAGGDGTVRLVAQAVAGTSTPMGLIPVGTGNLLARNLDLPLGSIKDLAQIAIMGVDKKFDVGRIDVQEPSAGNDATETGASHESEGCGVGSGQEIARGSHTFMVMGGVGFDADIMDSTNSNLKKKIGWLAYVQAAGPNLFAPKLKAKLRVSSGERFADVEARSIMFLNCGELTGGIVLDPSTDPADQWLDLAVLDVRGGILGWLDLVRRVVLKGVGFQPRDVISQNIVAGEISTRRFRECHIELEEPQQLQLDGDVIGCVQHFDVEVLRGALQIRVRS